MPTNDTPLLFTFKILAVTVGCIVGGSVVTFLTLSHYPESSVETKGEAAAREITQESSSITPSKVSVVEPYKPAIRRNLLGVQLVYEGALRSDGCYIITSPLRRSKRSVITRLEDAVCEGEGMDKEWEKQ